MSKLVSFDVFLIERQNVFTHCLCGANINKNDNFKVQLATFKYHEKNINFQLTFTQHPYHNQISILFVLFMLFRLTICWTTTTLQTLVQNILIIFSCCTGTLAVILLIQTNA